MAGPRSEADAAVAQAEGLLKTSVWALRFQPDWEQATPLFERAARLYDTAAAPAEAVAALRRAAEGFDRAGATWQAGKALEKAAGLAARVGGSALLDELHTEAARRFLEAGREDLAAEVLSRGARAVEQSSLQAMRGRGPGGVGGASPTLAAAEAACVDAKASPPSTALASSSKAALRAASLHARAVATLRGTGRGVQCRDVYSSATGFSLRVGQHAAAAAALLELAADAEVAGAPATSSKARLAAVVVLLAGGDAAAAWGAFREGIEATDFSSADEARAADRLLTAYRLGDAPAAREVVASEPSFRFLDNDIVRLARTLPVESSFERAREDLLEADALALPAAEAGWGGVDENDLT